MPANSVIELRNGSHLIVNETPDEIVDIRRADLPKWALRLTTDAGPLYVRFDDIIVIDTIVSTMDQ